ncbi:hypothetical protein [Hymenobacter metallilatus]|uniref:DUF3575 domain-containing protein n=1 Tax=Hymenobacter metallilatus TaxID=2493666 RepID=A0A3R9NF72_9BACT|nr:hypothetical protein [Hymenobacter metallilatus]RSK31103.1 hypothetical protein EI290_13865 [Hymenobacter metallilatus]
MIRNSSRIFRPGWWLAALLLSAVPALPALAQTAPDTTAPARVGLRHALRLDVGGILLRNVAYNALNTDTRLLLPVLVGYEQQLGRRSSGSVEVLLNGGQPTERTSGVALQGRYYLYQGRQTGLAGVYVAPTLGYRGVKQNAYYNAYNENRKLGGAGVLLGAQLPLGHQSRFLLDVAGGIMTWRRLNKSPYAGTPGYYDTGTYYEENGAVFDGRLSLGYRF